MASCIVVQPPAIWRWRGVIARKEMRLHCRSLIISVLRLAQNAIEQFLFDIEKAEAKISHKPFECRARGKIESACTNVNGSVTGRLDDIGINICASRVGEI